MIFYVTEIQFYSIPTLGHFFYALQILHSFHIGILSLFGLRAFSTDWQSLKLGPNLWDGRVLNERSIAR
jgi:hypothetical protein